MKKNGVEMQMYPSVWALIYADQMAGQFEGWNEFVCFSQLSLLKIWTSTPAKVPACGLQTARLIQTDGGGERQVWWAGWCTTVPGKNCVYRKTLVSRKQIDPGRCWYCEIRWVWLNLRSRNSGNLDSNLKKIMLRYLWMIRKKFKFF